MQRVHVTDAEWKLMELLWEESPRTITQMTAAMQDKTGWTKGTVIKLLSRLQARGAVDRQEGGRGKGYFPLVSRETVALQETENFLAKVFRGDVSLLVNAMADSRSLTREQIQELYEILRRAEENS